MGLFIKELYKLPEDPEAWGAFITESIKDFFTKNGKMPNSISAKKVLIVLIECVLELEGFTMQRVGFNSEIIEKLKDMEEFNDLEDFKGLEDVKMVSLLSPDGSYRLMSCAEDDTKILEFRLCYMNGKDQVVN